MATRINNVLFLAIAIAATLLPSSTAQTTHVVGDALGWLVPPNGAAAYSTWAANQTFTVGDILVFNFAAGSHDATQVTKTAFDACNTTSPISRQTNSPARITLTSSGEHYYICSFPGHCTSGQKLAINVSATSSSPSPSPAPAPQSSSSSPSPSPVSAPTPTSSAPTLTPTSAPTPSTTMTPTSAPTEAPTTSAPTTPSPSTDAQPPSTATAPSGATTPSGTPADNSAVKSLGVTGLSITFLATIVVGLLY